MSPLITGLAGVLGMVTVRAVVQQVRSRRRITFTWIRVSLREDADE